MSGRLWLPPPLESGRAVELEPRRAHYLVKVLRVRAGDPVQVFDGCGRAWRATVAVASTRECRLEIGALERSESSPLPLELVQAVIKGDAMDRLIQKATELGTTRLWLTASAFGQVSTARAQARLDHWRAIAASACEQSDRVWLPELAAAGALTGIGRIAGLAPQRLIGLHPGKPVLENSDLAACDGFVVGPEGGFAPPEVLALESAGIRLRSLGPAVLRAETAPIAALATLRHARGWV
jgi:16S rRNA (uracil1498-N3)-methyltransferase